MIRRVVLGVWALMVLLGGSGCDPDRVFEESQSVPGEAWKTTETVKFSVELTDTNTLHDLYFNLRNSGEYAYSNIYVFLNVIHPDERVERDTLEFMLADPTGKWLGSGVGDILDNQILFARKVRFPQAGTYTFEFEQAMRTESLAEVLDVGLRIERAQ